MARRVSKQGKGKLDGGQLTIEDARCTALYIRVSTAKQAEEGFSLDAQRAALESYCAAQGWTVCADHVYVDAGQSGKTTDRPAFQAMLQAAQGGQLARVVALKLDRMARSTRDFLAVVDLFKRAGVGLVLVKESFDTSTPMGEFALTLFAAIAQMERETIRERTMAGRRQKAAEGGHNGGRVPLGYDYDGKQWTANEAAATVRRIFDEFNAGAALIRIAEGLNHDNVTTATGAQWTATGVRNILRNGFYAGLVQYDDQPDVPGSHPAIVAESDYSAALDRLHNMKRGPSR